MIQAVVFDLDGLMFNTEEIFHSAGREQLGRRGIDDPKPILDQMMGRRAHEAFQIMKELVGMEESIEELRRESDSIFFEILHEQIAPMPGLFDLLDLIEEKNLPKAVATSSGRDYLEGILDRFELTERFHFTLTSADVTNGKPHPEIYLTAAEQLEKAPERVLVFEDSSNGTKAAAAAGTHIVSVPHQHSRHQDFSQAKYVASSLADPYILNLIQAAD